MLVAKLGTESDVLYRSSSLEDGTKTCRIDPTMINE
jgi:hypothetical protein